MEIIEDIWRKGKAGDWGSGTGTLSVGAGRVPGGSGRPRGSGEPRASMGAMAATAGQHGGGRAPRPAPVGRAGARVEPRPLRARSGWRVLPRQPDQRPAIPGAIPRSTAELRGWRDRLPVPSTGTPRTRHRPAGSGGSCDRVKRDTCHRPDVQKRPGWPGTAASMSCTFHRWRHINTGGDLNAG
jgi:hypothetical protein